MMEHRVLGQLEPQAVYRFFEELCRIPHESSNTRAASDWAESFARERSLRYRRDDAGNVIIWKDATPGYEDHPTVMLQGHLDMVCVKDNGVEHDFEKDPLDLYIDDGFVKARGTSLGGDDGIAVAMAMAILDDDSNIPHPPLEAVFTVDEEIGMLGAGALDCFDLKSKYLLNIDSEVEGVLTVGCAGGTRCEITLPLHAEAAQGALVTLNLEHLSGGHSGTAIHMGFANADKLMGECLAALGCPRLVSLSGGQQDNAIPNQCRAVILVDEDKMEAVTAQANDWFETARAQWTNDPNMTLTITAEVGSAAALSAAASKEALDLINALPNGVQAMSMEIHGLVQTSLNLGILAADQTALTATFCVRSSLGSQKEMLHRRLRTLMAQLGGTVSISGDYPAWEYRQDSSLRDLMTEVFQEQYGRKPKIEAIHAGVECGILSGKLPGLDCVSIGPNLLDIHTPRERMEIASVQRVWRFVLEVLKRSK